jgi:hypothetical protein
MLLSKIVRMWEGWLGRYEILMALKHLVVGLEKKLFEAAFAARKPSTSFLREISFGPGRDCMRR